MALAKAGGNQFFQTVKQDKSSGKCLAPKMGTVEGNASGNSGRQYG